MIYKFINNNEGMTLEVEHFEGGLEPDYVNFFISDGEESKGINLSKSDIYKLIGALHLIRKEMD